MYRLSGIRQAKRSLKEHIQEWRLQSNLVMLYPSYISYKDLKKDYDAYLNLDYDNKLMADWKSLELFGKNNQDRFEEMQSKFLKADIQDDLVDRTYKPKYVTENDTPSVFTIIEAIYDYSKGKDYVTLIETRNKIATMEDSITDPILHKLDTDIIEKKKHDIIPIIPKGTPFFTPYELEKLGVSYINKGFYSNNPDNVSINEKPVKEWFEQYKRKFKGYIGESYISDSSWNKKMLELYSDFDSIMDSGNKDFINARKQSILDLGWNPEVLYTHENIIKNSNRIKNKLEESLSIEILDLEDSHINFNNKINEDLNISESDMFITFMDYNKLGYKSIGIAFNESLSKIYKFNKDRNIFVEYELNKFNDIKVYAIKIPEQLKNNIENKVRSSYNTFNDKLNINILDYPDLIKNTDLVCNTFTNNILNLGRANIAEFIKHEGYIFNPRRFNIHAAIIYDGETKEYSTKEKEIKESTHSINDYVVLTEAKEFPIQFNDDGDLIISKGKNLDFEAEYSHTHTMIKQCEKADNIEGMEYCLIKLWYMNILLEQLIHEEKSKTKLKEYHKARAHIMGDIKMYLPKVMKKDKSFNIMKAYENSPFSDNKIVIKKSTIEAVIDLFKGLIKML